MSRVGRKPIEIPAGVQAVIEGNEIRIKGPKGELRRVLHPDVKVVQEGQALIVSPAKEGDLKKSTKALWGTTRQLAANMVEGVTKGYEKKLEIEGVGYRASVEGNTLVLTVGYTQPRKFEIPSGIAATIEKNVISLAGLDKELLGQFAASLRAARPVEPYKGKGIRYQGEQVRRKLGKKAATAGAGAK